jgi:ADP-ribosyl-[dinitrogen reductase] hydrolase
MRTSWLLAEDLKLPGRLGLTHGPGCFSATRDEDLRDLASRGADLLVCLQEPEELSRLEPAETLEERRAAVAAAGIGFLHVPVEDLSVPSIDVAEALVAELLVWLERGDRVVLHCHSGLGRAGTIAACVLVRCGYTAEGAVALVRFVRPGAVQSGAQERLIEMFATCRP